MAKKTAISETMVFNDYKQAEQMVKSAKQKQIRLLIGLGVAAICTVCSVLVLMGKAHMSLICVPLVFSLPAYLIGGGIGSALRTAKRLAAFGWRILPFPADIITGLVTFIYAVFAFFMMPLIFVLPNFFQHNKDYKAAKEYLSCYSNSSVTENTK